MRVAADRFLSERAEEFPSPIRWLWVLLVALTSRLDRRALSFASLAALPAVAWWAFGSWQAALLCSTSPLAWQLGRRALQDVTVAAAALVALGFALHGSPIRMACAVFALLSLKEAGVLYLPALAVAAWLSGVPALSIGAALGVALASWLVVTRLVVGRDTFRVLRSLRSGHGSQYSKQHQRGAPNRLLVDIALVSPVPMVLLFSAESKALVAFAGLALVAHALSPVRNVRTVLAVDLAIRALVIAALAQYPAALLAAMVVDVAIFWRIRNVYDPVTSELTRALRMA